MWPGFLIDHTFFRKTHWHLISEWTLGLVNALNHHWCETSYYLKWFWNMWCSEISFSRIPCVGPVLYPEEVYGIVSYLIFSISFYITFKRKLQHLGHKRVICGSHVDCSVGQVGQQVWSTFNPGLHCKCIIIGWVPSKPGYGAANWLHEHMYCCLCTKF